MASRAAWIEVGDRVFVRRYRTWNGEPFDQNVGAVIGADGVVVIDTRASHRLADELRDTMRSVRFSPPPPTTIGRRACTGGGRFRTCDAR